MSDILDAMRAFMHTFDPPPARALHCGVAVWDVLRDMAPKDTAPIGLGAALGGLPLYGVPVHIDLTMTAGRREMREGDTVVASGDIAPPGRPNALYVPGVGLVEFSRSVREMFD